MQWLEQVLKSSPDAATLEHLRSGLSIWMNSGTKARRDQSGRLVRPTPVSLSRCLGLPDNPENARTKLRNMHLRAAALCLECDATHPWKRAESLRAAVGVFSGHKWLCWAHLADPPNNALDLEKHLFLAMRAGGGNLPTTIKSYSNILKS